MTATDLVYDPYDRETGLNPHPVFRRLREEAPLYYDAGHDFWALSRFDDVERAHLDRETFLSGRGCTLDILKRNLEIPPGTVIFEDAPTHTIHRALLSRMFTPRRVGALEPEIRRFCVEVLDPLVGRGGFDFVEHLGNHIPMRVIGMLLGIPESNQEAVRDHFDLAHKLDAEKQNNDVLYGEIFAEYVDWRVDHPSDDIMTQLLRAEFEDETGKVRRLTREELLAYVNIVAAAGNDTTRILIAWAGKLLAEHPDQRRILVEEPGFIPNAVEEILRFEPPPLQSCRWVARDVEFHGRTVPRGSIMALLLGAANRDEARFSQPDLFDVRRSPSAIFTFGFGAHYCLGHALARLEGRIVLEELLKRFPHWEVDRDHAVFPHRSPDLRSWDAMPVLVP